MIGNYETNDDVFQRQKSTEKNDEICFYSAKSIDSMSYALYVCFQFYMYGELIKCVSEKNLWIECRRENL